MSGALLLAQVDAVLDGGPYDLAAPTRLPGWDVAALLGHLAGTLERVVQSVSAPCPGQAGLDAVSWWGPGVGASPPDGPGDLARLRLARDAAAEVLRAVPGSRVVGPDPRGIVLGEYARTRLLEAVVHGLDLGAEPVPEALRATALLLEDVLARADPGRSRPPVDDLAWVEMATGRRPAPRSLSAVLPLLG